MGDQGESSPWREEDQEQKSKARFQHVPGDAHARGSGLWHPASSKSAVDEGSCRKNIIAPDWGAALFTTWQGERLAKG